MNTIAIMRQPKSSNVFHKPSLFNRFISNSATYNHFIILCQHGMKNALKVFKDMNLELAFFGVKVKNIWKLQARMSWQVGILLKKITFYQKMVVSIKTIIELFKESSSYRF